MPSLGIAGEIHVQRGSQKVKDKSLSSSAGDWGDKEECTKDSGKPRPSAAAMGLLRRAGEVCGRLFVASVLGGGSRMAADKQAGHWEEGLNSEWRRMGAS